MEKKMELPAIGILIALGLGLTVMGLVIIVVRLKKEIEEISWRLQKVMWAVGATNEAIGRMGAPVQNIIHLGLKDGQMTTGIAPATLSIRHEDFEIRAEKLKENLMRAMEGRHHPNIGTRAFCILDMAGVDKFVDNNSFRELQKALTRLLTNNDSEAIKRFLDTVADSICHAQGGIAPAE